MRKIESFIRAEMKRFVVSQKTKFGYDDGAKLNGYTVKQLEEKGSRIACSELYGIFQDYFDEHDTHRFWFDLQIGVYELKGGKLNRPTQVNQLRLFNVEERKDT